MLNIVRLKKYFPVTKGIFKRVSGYVKAVDEVSFEVKDGEAFALVGESGSGKTTLAKTVTRLYAPTDGEIIFDGQDISKLKGKELKAVRRGIQMVFQDPNSALNPQRRVKSIIAAPFEIHKVGGQSERIQRVERLLELVELPPKEFLYRYPRGLSGGEKQRVGIARALALNPKCIVLDEPTSALDVSVQAKILELLERLQREFHLTYLLITHNLRVVRNFSDQIAVMYLGKICETASTIELFKTPLHPYTKALLSSMPIVTEEEKNLIPKKITLEGEIPSPFNPPSGCRFHSRCNCIMKQICESEHPEMVEAEKNHYVACHLYSGKKRRQIRT